MIQLSASLPCASCQRGDRPGFSRLANVFAVFWAGGGRPHGGLPAPRFLPGPLCIAPAVLGGFTDRP